MMNATSIPYPLELTTPRLVIRSPWTDDAAAVNAAIVESLAELRPWMPWAQREPTLAETEQNMAKSVERFKAGADYRLNVFLKDSGQFVGGSGLHNAVWSVPRFEIGYWCRTSLVGNGYVSEAVREIARYAVEGLGARRVEVRMGPENVRSWKVAERLGFALEGILRNETRNTDGTLRDTRVYALLGPGG